MAHVADLVEEQRAAFSLLEFADLIVIGAREAAFHVAEELGFDEFFRNSGATHLDKGSLVPKALGMECARDEFLAGAAFPINEHAAVGWRGHGDLLAERLHGHAVTHDLVLVDEFAAQYLVFFLQSSLLHGVAHQDDDFFERERLFDEVEGAQFCGANRRFNVSVP